MCSFFQRRFVFLAEVFFFFHSKFFFFEMFFQKVCFSKNIFFMQFLFFCQGSLLTWLLIKMASKMECRKKDKG